MTKTNTYRRCWMEVLGGCSGKLSREHVVSEKVLKHLSDSAIGLTTVAPDGSSQTNGIGSVTIRNLCAHHNSGTGVLDDEAQRLVSAVESFVRLNSSERLIAAGAAPERTVVINGHLFERWTVKTFLNVYMSGNLRHKDEVLPMFDLINPGVAEYVFNGRGLPFPQGLYGIDPGAPLLNTPHRHTHNYMFRPIAAIVQNRATGERRQFPIFMHLKIKVWNFATVSNLLKVSDDQFAEKADKFFECYRIPAEFRPPHKVMSNTPPGEPQTHTQLKIQFEWQLEDA